MKIFEIFAYDECSGGIYGEHTCYITANTKEEAIEAMDEPYDPFWIDHGIQEVSVEVVKVRLETAQNEFLNCEDVLHDLEWEEQMKKW